MRKQCEQIIRSENDMAQLSLSEGRINYVND